MTYPHKPLRAQENVCQSKAMKLTSAETWNANSLAHHKTDPQRSPWAGSARGAHHLPAGGRWAAGAPMPGGPIRAAGAPMPGGAEEEGPAA